ncbi:MAG: hypothetical protein ACRDCY_18030 [Aeromonas veronii]
MIRINSMIRKLNDNDPGFLLRGVDVEGWAALVAQMTQVQDAMTVVNSNVAQKLSGLHVEDIHNNAFDDIDALHFIGATVTDDGSRQVTITIDPTFNVSNGQEQRSTSVDVESLEFPGATITTRNNGKIAVVAIQQQATSATPASGVVVSNGVDVYSGVGSIEFPSSKVVDKGAGVVEVKPFLSMENNSGADYNTYEADALGIVYPLKVEQSFRGPGTPTEGRMQLTIDHAAFEPMRAPGFLAYINDEENVVGRLGGNGKTKFGTLWFDDVVYGGGPYVSLKMDLKQYGIQEADGSDPNISGGQNYLIAFRVNIKGSAVSGEGYVRAYLREYSEVGADIGYLTDVNGQPLAFERHYKVGDKLGSIDVIGVVNAKALRYFSCHVEDTFADSYITLTDPTEGVTGLMIQALTANQKTGPALLQFESDTNQDISFSSHYLGDKRSSIDWLIRSNSGVSVCPAKEGLTMADGFGIYNVGPIKFGTEDGHLFVSDDGTNILDFNFHRVFNAEETQMLRGKEIYVNVTITDKDCGWVVALMKWTGVPDQYTKEIYESRTNENPNFQTNWVVAGNLFISEDAVKGDHTETKAFTVPTDANNYAVIIYPVEAQQPCTLKLKQFEVDVVNAFTGYVLHFAESDRERALAFSEQHRTLYQDNQGYGALRYTINGTDQPMPIGELGAGLADIAIDKTLNVIAGTMAKGGEGGIEFRADGNAKITTGLRLWNEKNVGAAVLFWYELVEAGQQRGTMIDSSKLTITVPANSKGILYTMPTFSIGVIAGQRLILRVTGDGADCAFLQSVSPSAPMLYTTVELDEMTGQGYDAPLSFPELSTQFAAEIVGTLEIKGSKTFNRALSVEDGTHVTVRSAVKVDASGKRTNLNVTSWAYDPTTKTVEGVLSEAPSLGIVYLSMLL